MVTTRFLPFLIKRVNKVSVSLREFIMRFITFGFFSCLERKRKQLNGVGDVKTTFSITCNVKEGIKIETFRYPFDISS